MIAFVKGTVFKIEDAFAIIDTGLVGAKIYMPPSNLAKLKIGDEVFVHTFLRVAEDVFDLYGFLTDEELVMFKKIISVSGAGPKAGISVLSAMSPSELALAIATDNFKAITKAQGVGPKLAQKIVLELKDKIENSELLSNNDSSFGTAINNVSTKDDAIEALVVLGYTRGEAMQALSGCDKALATDEKIKFALKALMR